MAPSPNRRTGSSRRAQYGTFFGYIAGVLGALLGAALLVVALLHPGAFAGVRMAASDVAAPGGTASAGVRGGGRSLVETVQGYFLAGSRDAQLARDLRLARTQLAEAQAVNDENRRLKALLGIAAAEPRPVAVAKLTSSTAASTRRFATLDAGQSRGVAVGMPVRSPTGLIGRVLEVGGGTARVLLITDTDSLVPVRRATDGVAAFAQGRGDGRLQIKLINLGINPLRRGDVFVTSGSGGLYRPGTAVAAVMQVTRDGGIAQVLSDPAAVDYVVVDQAWSPAAALPSAAPSPSPGFGVAR
jgi:rod shape-determining protein MreC